MESFQLPQVSFDGVNNAIRVQDALLALLGYAAVAEYFVRVVTARQRLGASQRPSLPPRQGNVNRSVQHVVETLPVRTQATAIVVCALRAAAEQALHSTHTYTGTQQGHT